MAWIMTFTGNGKTLKLPLYAGHINNYDEYTSSMTSIKNAPITLYENIDNPFKDVPEKTYEDVYNATNHSITEFYTWTKDNSIILRIEYKIYDTAVVGNTNNQGMCVLMQLGYGQPTQSGFKVDRSCVFGFGTPNPTPYNATYAAVTYGFTPLYYDSENETFFTVSAYSFTITQRENLIGQTYGNSNTISGLRAYRPSGTYQYSNQTDWGNVNYNRITDSDIGSIIYLPIANNYNISGKIYYNRITKTEKPPQYPDTPDNDNEPSPPITGDGDTTSDAIPDPPQMPIWDINNTGFVTVYNPTVQQIRELAYFMWSGDFTDLIKKMFTSPFEAIISLKMLFVDVPTGTSQTVWLGNVETTVSMPKLSKQFIDIDLGAITVNEFFGSFADYAPFTKIQIFLPFIGYKDLNVDEVMNANLHLRYRVDVYSGACIAFLTVTKEIKSTSLNSILYQFDGNCAMELPFTQNDNSRYVAAILNSAASSALSLAATSGFTTPTAATGFSKGQSAQFELGSLAPVANGMLDVLSTKPNVQRAGSLAGAVAAMGVKQPYIIIHRPIAQMPTNYQHYLGIPLNLTRQLSTVSGYTIVSQVFMTSTTATEVEIVMITELLKNGVIF